MRAVAFRPQYSAHGALCGYESCELVADSHAALDAKAEELGAVRLDKGTHVEVLLHGEWFCLPPRKGDADERSRR